jgi:PAS domain S-box-containing protein
MAAPLPPNESSRLERLKSYQILDTAAEQSFDDLTLLASRICGTPAAFISFIDADRQWFKSFLGASLKEKRREDAICAHTILQNDVLVVKDLRGDERFANNPQVQSGELRFYAGVTFFSSDGYALGRLVGHHLENHKRRIESEQVLAEKNRLSEELDTHLIYFRTILDTSRDGVLVEDDEKIRYMNAAYAKLYGAESADELLGEHLSNLAAPEDLERLLEYGRRRSRGESAPTQYEFRIRRKDGTLVEVEGTVSNFHLAGKHYIITFVRDIRDRKKNEREREDLIAKLQDALARVKTLSGLLPICASCKKIRDDQGTWKELEEYVEARTEADFSHGICPDCARKLYPDVFEKD